ncbi:MAG: PEP-CTERM sorting domain-containing protein [Alphaproteobacteria bacterium]|nr:PEP-CTERM sorting domain-containing protein [Alphaproteobacteria bacterium]
MSAIRKAAVSAALGAFVLAAAPASATVYIGLQEAGVNSGNITTVASDPSTAVFAGSYGTFTVNSITADDGISPLLLGSVSYNKVSTSTPGTLYVWITETGLTSPVGDLKFTSGLTENFLTKGWTVTEETGYDPANHLYAGTLLDAHAFTGIDAKTLYNLGNVGSGPYSLTELYEITALGKGSALSTITVQADPVPEPATWTLMLMGMLGLGAMARQRKTVKA